MCHKTFVEHSYYCALYFNSVRKLFSLLRCIRENDDSSDSERTCIVTMTLQQTSVSYDPGQNTPIFCFTTRRSVNGIFPGLESQTIVETQGAREERERAWTAKTAARRRSLSMQRATFERFLEIDLCPWQPTRPLCAAGLCRCPFKQIDHRRTGRAHCRSIEQFAGRKGRKMAMRLGQMREKVAVSLGKGRPVGPLPDCLCLMMDLFVGTARKSLIPGQVSPPYR